MALSIENFIEKKIWDEWSNRLKLLKTYYIRKKFYPNNITFLETLEKEVNIRRRNSVNYAISQRDEMEMNYVSLTIEEKELWQSKCKKIDNIDFTEYILDNKTEEYFDEIEAFEYERLMILKDMTSKRYQEKKLREAADGLILLYKISNEEVKNKKNNENKVIQSFRRSCRLLKKCQKV